MASCGAEHLESIHGVHDHLDTAARLSHAELICQQAGARLTPLRKQVLKLIFLAQRPMGAYDLLANLKAPDQRPAAPPTVYRALDFLMEYGLIHRLSSINAYIPCCHPRGGHQAAFLICQQCHKVTEASAQGLLSQIEVLTAADQFAATQSTIEITGLCQKCQHMIKS